RLVELGDVGTLDRVLVEAGARLDRAVLVTTSLSEADLSDAILHRADLRNADLRRAVLRNADLRMTLLGGIQLDGADINDVLWSR
ncbi:MAG TPA: pentapeptide repeat-containing protein, partial [Caldilineaceae bacterium]|nr:pentapeptide repeat-containing protein [Caldilineaceae bacterium]